ncbi:hypothetical protein PX554_06725 [Sphingomonas sp. H39-1-10]|uniref:hypothetical protein n=1 Tax=Sphingomonas TaxID=13687 RepID=UPI00115F9D07|nr:MULTISPECIES: hypothetical protein [Sphingomonas]MDF0487818.1 hypothetical protein [Sphingomonas pollutisoli]
MNAGADPADPDIVALQASVDNATNALEAAAVTATSGHTQAPPKVWWNTQNAMTISSAVLLFGVVVIALAAFTAPKETSVEGRLRFFGTIMIITMATFLVVAGYDDKQIAAPLGLLGTIVGYLLGRETSTRPPDPEPATLPDEDPPQRAGE